MIVVLDTNVIVAALRSRRGASNRLLREIIGGKAKWACSVPLFLEYEAVLTRPEFLLETGYREPDIHGFLDDVASVILPVDLTFLWRPQLRDPKDEMVLETAVNGGADVLTTFNLKDFRHATSRFGLELLTPKQLLERLE